jgi:hypothetical protein
MGERRVIGKDAAAIASRGDLCSAARWKKYAGTTTAIDLKMDIARRYADVDW